MSTARDVSCAVFRRAACLVIAASFVGLVPSDAYSRDEVEWARLQREEAARHEARWNAVARSLFGDRSIADGGALLEMRAPKVPADPAVVPIGIRALVEQSPDYYIKKITVLVDHNPSPLAAVFHLTPRNGVADLSARVRVAEFSHVRAIAETSDGKLHMVSRFVRASGGCDVAPAFDADSLMSKIGKMQLRLPGGAKRGEPSRADLRIAHPNFNGMQRQSSSGVFIPLRTMEHVEVRYGDEPLMRIEGHLSLSHDPQFRFFYVPEDSGEISVRIVDSAKAEFQRAWPVRLEGDAGS